MTTRIGTWLRWPGGLLLASCWAVGVHAQAVVPDNAAAPDLAVTASATATPEPAAVAHTPDAEAGTQEKRAYPLLPIGARQAMERGYHLQRALGASGMLIHNVQNMDSSNLAVAFAKGEDPPADANLIPVPFVTTTELESHTANAEFKADVWLFPFLNLFAGVGKVKGHINIGVDIDLDAFVPPPFCRPAKPCGHVDLPFTADVDNTAFTLGGIVGYGTNRWFAALSLAQTLTSSSQDRSDLKVTNIGARLGPRWQIGRTAMLTPYVGANYFKLDATVSGVVRSGPVFEDGDSINLRYSVDLSSSHPWAVVAGGNLELSEHWALQGEYNGGKGSRRFVLSATFRP